MSLKKKIKKLNAQKVLVGLSGGVDSAVSVLLLKKQGLDPIGTFFIFSENNRKGLKKTMALAEKLGIELIVKDFSNEFEEKIISYFVQEYQAGRTPNPCVFCNSEIKFEKLFQLADARGVKWIATGHYASIDHREDGTLGIRQAFDETKDQSYFLYRIKKNQLKRLVFPLGKIKKEKVKEIAQKNELVFSENESQDVCFFQTKEGLSSFLKARINLKKGKIVNEKEEPLGYHLGQALFTIGQRQGIKLSNGPFFVIGKDAKKNWLKVTSCRNHPRLWAKNVLLEKVSWTGTKPLQDRKYFLKSRYRAKPSAGKIFFSKKEKAWEVNMETPQWAMAEGQSLVVYDERGFVWGGGVIKKVF